MNSTPLSGSLNAAGGGFPPIVSNANVIYVSANGSDTYTGSNINYPKATIADALATAASTPRSKVQVLDGYTALGAAPVTIPFQTTLDFGNGTFAGGIVMEEGSAFYAGTHIGVTGLASMVELTTDIGTDQVSAPRYTAGSFYNTSPDYSEEGINGFAIGSLSRLSINVQQVYNKGRLLWLGDKSRIDASLGQISFDADDAVLIRFERAGAIASIKLSTLYDADDASPPANCRVAVFASPTALSQNYLNIQGHEIWLVGAGCSYVDWVLAADNAIYGVTSLPTNLSIDYANGFFAGLEPQQLASADQNGLVPLGTMDGTKVLTNTNPNPTFV